MNSDATARRMSSSSRTSSPRSNFRELDTEFLTRQAKIWIEKVLDKRYDDEETVADLLADGEILFEISKLISSLMQKKYGAVIDSPLSLEATAFGKQSGKYVPYSNVDAFLKICKKVGLTGVDLFSPPDAVEKRDVRRVCLCIRALSNKARSKHLDLPDFDIVTHFAFMPTDMVEGMQKCLEQIWYNMSNEESGPGLEGSRKINEPFHTELFKIFSQEPENAEIKLEQASSENGSATVGNLSVSLRSPPFKDDGWSSQRSTPIKDTLPEVHTPLTPVIDDFQKVKEVSRSMNTFITGAVSRNLEKLYGLHTKKPLDKVYDPLFPKDRDERKYNEDPVILTVNGHLANSLSSKFGEHFVSSIHKDLIESSGLLHSESPFSDLKRENDHVENVKDMKANGMHVVYTPKESLPKKNSNMQINSPSKTELLTDYGVHYPNNNAPEEFAHSSSVSVSHGTKQETDDLEVKSTNMREAMAVEVGLTKRIKLDDFNADPESTLEEDHAAFYSESASGVISSNIISEILLNSYHVENHNLPKMEHLDVEYANKAKSDNDLVSTDLPKTDGVDAECMTTDSSLVIINALSTPLLMNKDVEKADENAASMSVSQCTGQGGANSAEVYINIPKNKEVEVGSINKLKLGLKNAGNEDNMINNFRIAPPVLTVDVDQCVNKAKSDVLCKDIPKEDYVKIVNACGLKVDSMKNNYIVVTKESIVNVGCELEEDNVDNNSTNALKSHIVDIDSTTNSRREYSSYAIATEEDSAVVAGNVLEADNYDNSKKLLKSKALDIGNASSRQFNNISDLVVAEVDPVFYAVDGLEADKIGIDSINVLKSNIVNAVHAACEKSNCMNCRVIIEEDKFVNAAWNNVLKIDDVYHDSRNMVKSDDIHVDSVVNKKTGNINFAAVTSEDSVVIAGNGLVADNGDDSSKNVLKSENIAAADCDRDIDLVNTNSRVDSDAKMKIECNYAFVTEKDSVINVYSGLEADTVQDRDNVYHDCTNVGKSDDIHVGSVESKKAGNMNFAAVTSKDIVVITGKGLVAENSDDSKKYVLKSEDIAAPDCARDMELVDTNYVVDSDAKMKTAIVTEKDGVIYVDSGLVAGAVNDNSIHLPKPKVIGVVSAANMKTGDSNCAVVTVEDCVANAGKGLEIQIANVHEKSVKSLSLKTIGVDSSANMKTKDMYSPIVNEADSFVNMANELETSNINNCVLQTKKFEANSSPESETRDIKCAVVTEKDNIVNQGNGFKTDNVSRNLKNFLISETVDVDSDMNMNAVSREENNVANVRHGLEAGTIENECKSMSTIESLNILSSKSRKLGNDLRDISANLPDEINVNIDRSDVSGEDDMDTDYFCIETFKPCQASDGNDALIADVIESPLHARGISEHDYGNVENSNNIDIKTTETNKSEGKIMTKLNKKKIWVSVAACGLAVIGTAMMYIQRQKRKSEDCEINKQDTLAGISKKVGKSNWKELVLINPEIRDPDLIYPGQRLKLA